MITRVTEQLRYMTVSNDLTRIQLSTNNVLEQISSQKKINRPSDDPTGMSKVLDYRAVKSSIAQYSSNIDNAEAWTKMTETALEQTNDLLDQAIKIGMNYEDSSLNSSYATSVDQIMTSIMSTANTKMGNRYIFAGSRTDTKPFVDVTDATVTAGVNVFDGTSQIGGVYTGNTNHNYAVAITGTGAFGVATYSVDGVPQGTVPASGTITVGSGLTMTFGTGTQPLTNGDTFTVQATTSAAIEATVAASGNSYAGTATSGAGPYTGTKNKTYAVKITGAGALGAATYSYSADGGKTWTVGGTIPAGGTINLAEGVSMSFTAGTFAVNDMFYANAKAPGFYKGNGENLTLDIGQGDLDMSYNISGEEVYTNKGTGAGYQDIFANLRSLKLAVQNGDTAGVETYTENLRLARDHITGLISNIGFKEQALTSWKDNYTILDNKISDLKSSLEDTDMTKMIADYQMKQTALDAAYTIASQISKTSILDFIT
jgi:flagellar hook-associated protein 3 FlgL